MRNFRVYCCYFQKFKNRNEDKKIENELIENAFLFFNKILSNLDAF